MVTRLDVVRDERLNVSKYFAFFRHFGKSDGRPGGRSIDEQPIRERDRSFSSVFVFTRGSANRSDDGRKLFK